METKVFALLSAQLSGLDRVSNDLRTKALYRDLYYTPFLIRRVQGKWQDFIEETFQVFKPENYPFGEWLERIQELAERFDQECILVCSDDQCDLFWPDGRREYLGVWQHCPDVPLRTLDSWTRINEEYFYAA